MAVRDGGDEFLVLGPPGGRNLAKKLDDFRRSWPDIYHAASEPTHRPSPRASSSPRPREGTWSGCGMNWEGGSAISSTSPGRRRRRRAGGPGDAVAGERRKQWRWTGASAVERRNQEAGGKRVPRDRERRPSADPADRRPRGPEVVVVHGRAYFGAARTTKTCSTQPVSIRPPWTRPALRTSRLTGRSSAGQRQTPAMAPQQKKQGRVPVAPPAPEVGTRRQSERRDRSPWLCGGNVRLPCNPTLQPGSRQTKVTTPNRYTRERRVCLQA